MNFYHEILPVLISLFGIIGLILIRKKVSKESYLFSLWVSGIVFFRIYIFLILSTSALDAHYWTDYNSYDLNKDGLMDKSERTAGFQKAHKRVVNDTARNLVFFTGVIISILVSTTVLTVGIIGTYFKLKMNKAKNYTQ
jgi:hypothetical protein